jgi:signal recognition particle receptor subunit beta
MGVQFQPIAESARDLADAVSEFPDLFARAARLADRVAAGRFHVAVLGEFKRGKSTVINALVGYPVLPTGVVPCTAVITEVRSGSGSATVLHLDGTIEPVAVGQIPDFVTETANPENRRGVERVVVAVPGSLLDSGLVIVDTPGVGSVYEHNTETARQALADADGAILVLGADAPLSRNERELLEVLSARRAPVFVVVNRCDVVDQSDHAEIRGFVGEQVGRALDSPEIYLVAARAALQAKAGDTRASDPGEFPVFEAALRRFVHDDLREALIVAARHELDDLADEVEERLRLHEATARLRVDELAARMLVFERAAKEQSRLLDDDLHLLHRDLQAVREQLASRLAQSAREAPTAARHLRAAVTTTAATHLEQALNDEVQRQVKMQMAAIRVETRVWMATEWKRCATEVRDRVQGRIDSLRATAGRLFDMNLRPIDVPSVEDQPDRFSYLFVRVGSSTEAFEALGLRFLPRGVRQRRALARAIRDLDHELDKHAGRARVALCEQLVGVEQQYAAMLRDELDDFVTVIRQAATRAEQLRALGEAEAARCADQRRRIGAAATRIRVLRP